MHTIKDNEKIQAGFETDKLIHEKIFGVNRVCYVIPKYSTNITDAWKIFEEFRKRNIFWCPSIFWDDDDGLSTGYWNCDFFFYGEKDSDFRMDEAFADTAPLAICRAALFAAEKGL